MNLHYHFRPAFEVMWTPYGVTSNLCRGVARNAYAGEKVTLQPCGNFPKTLWVVRSGFFSSGQYGGFELINGSTMNPSVPYVLTAGGSLWGGNPFATLQLNQPVADDGVVNPVSSGAPRLRRSRSSRQRRARRRASARRQLVRRRTRPTSRLASRASTSAELVGSSLHDHAGQGAPPAIRPGARCALSAVRWVRGLRGASELQSLI